MPLSPFDVACIRKANELTSSMFFEKYATLVANTEDKIPRAFLNILSSSRKKDKRCPYVVERNEKTLDARPLVCRIYPIIRAIDNNGISYFARIEEAVIKQSKKSKKFTLDTWIKQAGAKKWLEESERFESLLREIVGQNRYDFSEYDKTTVASMLYSPDAFASEDLFGSYLKRPELALEAMEFGYSRARKLLDDRHGKGGN